jgi:hypothetical protein
MEVTMKKRVFVSVTMLGLFLTLAGAPADAKSRGLVVATIPFQFIVGGKSLEPGRYAVRSVSNDVLLIQSKGRSSAMNLTSAISANKASAETRLVFHRYGERYFLSEVWTAGETSGHRLFKCRLERSLERETAARPSNRLARAGYDRVEIVGVLE